MITQFKAKLPLQEGAEPSSQLWSEPDKEAPLGILFLILGIQGSALLSHVVCKNKPKTLSGGAIVK